MSTSVQTIPKDLLILNMGVHSANDECLYFIVVSNESVFELSGLIEHLRGTIS